MLFEIRQNLTSCRKDTQENLSELIKEYTQALQKLEEEIKNLNIAIVGLGEERRILRNIAKTLQEEYSYVKEG